MREPDANVAASSGRGAWAVRICTVAVSLLAVGWLMGNLRAYDLTEAATGKLSARGAAKSSAAEVRADFDRSKRFNDDTDVLLREAAGLALSGDRKGAVAAATSATRKEPRNFDAWVLLFALQRGADPAQAAIARRQALEFDPQFKALR